MGNPDALFPNDVRRLVKTDHVHILALFHVYLVANTESRRGIIDQILHDLILHMSMEEDLLYPELTRSTDLGKKVAEKAFLEHTEVKSMIHELQQAESDDDQAMDAFFEDMMQTVRAHFMEEERDMLPLVERTLAPSTLAYLGTSMKRRQLHQ